MVISPKFSKVHISYIFSEVNNIFTEFGINSSHFLAKSLKALFKGLYKHGEEPQHNILEMIKIESTHSATKDLVEMALA